jgi:isoquinoline 1-oxidoreductase beta subunit
MLRLSVNGEERIVHADPSTALLWVLRNELGLKGAKYGCGVGQCGTCTVLVDGKAARACVTPAADAEGHEITTIEGLARRNHPLIAAWIAEQVPQCGYCQPGMIVAAAALSAGDDAAIDAALSGVLCRCGTYGRARRAIRRAAASSTPSPDLPAKASTLEPAATEAAFAPGPWIKIQGDGTVTVVIDRAEMGQGVVTSLAMLVAEELEVDLDQVRTEFAPASLVYRNPEFGMQATGGSTSVRTSWEPLRRAGATAREMLVSAAAKSWGVPKRECRAQRGRVVHIPTHRRLGYGELAPTAARLATPNRTPLKERSAFRIVGKSVPRIEIPSHVEGRTVFGADVALPGMLYAVALRCPAWGGRLVRFEEGRARAMKGVRAVLRIESGLSVVAETVPDALAGRQALQVTWDDGPNAKLSSTDIRARFERSARSAGKIRRNDGDAEAALAAAPRVIEAVYETPYLAHATMEPMNCTADVRADSCDVWVSTQAQTAAQEAAARAAGLPMRSVRIHSTFLGGGFGRRLQTDYVSEAVETSKAVGQPVQLVWTREDDFAHDFYRPANYTLLQGALDSRKRPIAWFQRTVGPSPSLHGIDNPYAITNLREETVEEDPGVPTGPWRSVGASQNAFAIEGFVDELAFAASVDPIVFRRRLLAQAPRHRRALDLAARKAQWGESPPPGHYRGAAVYFSFESWVAEIAEVSVSPQGVLKVHRVVCAIDCGSTVHPDTVAAQVEGAVAMGLSAALREEITIENGRAEQASFADYRLLSFPEMPEVEVHIVPGHEPPGGVGEPGLPPIAPAVANAIFAATGRRIRRLPFSESGALIG